LAADWILSSSRECWLSLAVALSTESYTFLAYAGTCLRAMGGCVIALASGRDGRWVNGGIEEQLGPVRCWARAEVTAALSR